MPKKLAGTKVCPIRFDGSDSDYLYFSTSSWSTRGVRYDICISKDTGVVTCSCMDSVCRHKSPGLVKLLERKNDYACKHQRLLRETYNDLLTQ